MKNAIPTRPAVAQQAERVRGSNYNARDGHGALEEGVSQATIDLRRERLAESMRVET